MSRAVALRCDEIEEQGAATSEMPLCRRSDPYPASCRRPDRGGATHRACKWGHILYLDITYATSFSPP